MTSTARPVYLQRVILQLIAGFAVFFGLYIALLETTLHGIERRVGQPKQAPDSWQADYETIQIAARFARWHLGAQDLQARMALLGAQRFAADSKQSMDRYADARDAARRSTTQRPNWAPSWLNLAIAEYVLDANNAAWQTAAARALALQERTIRHQIALAKLRKQAERNLPPALAEQFQRAAITAVLDYPAEYIDAVRRLARPQWVCPPASSQSQQVAAYDPDRRLTPDQLAAISKRCS